MMAPYRAVQFRFGARLCREGLPCRARFDRAGHRLEGFLSWVTVGQSTGVGGLSFHSGDIGIGAVAQDTYFCEGPMSAECRV